jgi:tetratricopeptide (TPR) repeat protein
MASTGAASAGAPAGDPPTNAPDPGTSSDDPLTKPKPTRGKWSIFSGSATKKKPSVVASKLVAKGDIDEALEIIEDALRDIDAVENDAPVLDDDRASLHALAAMCHSQNESMRSACEHFDAALDAAEDEEATTGRRAVAKGPKGPIDAEFFYRMGEACHRRNMHGRCAAAYDEAMEKDPKRKKLPSRLTPSMVHHQAGVSCRECKRYEEALEHFTGGGPTPGGGGRPRRRPLRHGTVPHGDGRFCISG